MSLSIYVLGAGMGCWIVVILLVRTKMLSFFRFAEGDNILTKHVCPFRATVDNMANSMQGDFCCIYVYILHFCQ